jgi:FAD/FMN-containing dehydrogenase
LQSYKSAELLDLQSNTSRAKAYPQQAIMKFTAISHTLFLLSLSFQANLCHARGEEEDSCGLTCVGGAKNVDVAAFEKCLKENFSEGLGGGEVVFPYPYSDKTTLEEWNKARTQQLNAYKTPKAVVYAKSTEDVQNAVKCAYESGIKVSARGRGHSLQGWAVVDGALVVDMTNICNPTVDHEAKGTHILKGSKYIATITAGAGCTNAVMLSAVSSNFEKKDGAMVLIGSCPSVGIAGYTLGGGMGDVTPYTGYAADLLTELEMVLYNGTVVTANEEQHSDLFWASRGGGGGNGIVTSLTYKVVQAPQKATEENPKFTQLMLYFSDKKEAFKRLQRYLYNGEASYKLGGNAALIFDDRVVMTFTYLGSWEDAINALRDARLVDTSILSSGSNKSIISSNYKAICGDDNGPCSESENGVPPYGVEARDYFSYAEMEGRVICIYTKLSPSWTNRTDDICDDLGLDDEYCDQGVKDKKELKCDSQVVLKQLLKVSGNPTSFMNTGGIALNITQSLNGLLLPPLEDSTMERLAELNIALNHFGQGAPELVPSDATAFPWRKAGILASTVSDAAANALLEDKAFKNDANKLQGYYNYMSPEIPNWRRFYFNENWERLVQVKGMYDPLNVFGKPITAETPTQLEPPKKKGCKRFLWIFCIGKGRSEL